MNGSTLGNVMRAGAGYRNLGLAILILVTLCAFWSVTGHNFIQNWDDYDYVVTNRAIQGLGFDNLQVIFSSFYIGNYAPLHLLSYIPDYLLWGLDPRGYHVSNLFIHILNGILVYRLLVGMGLVAEAALFGAALFLLHPVQVESVAWISERKNLLACCFFLLAFLRYQRFRKGEAEALRHYAAALFYLVLALLSKSVAVVFPLVVICYDFSIKESSRRPVKNREYVPFLLLAVIAGGLAIISQTPETGGGRRDYPGGGLLATLWTMAPVLVGYLKDIVYPLELSPYYIVPIRQTADTVALVSILLLGGLGVFLAVTASRWPRQFFFAMMFFICLLPVLQIIPILTLKNDRYLYLPMIGVAGLASLLLARLLQTSSRLRLGAVALAISICITLSGVTHFMARQWYDEITLWNFALRQDPENMLAWLMLTKGYTKRSDMRAAGQALKNYHKLKLKYGPLRGWEGFGA